jgi:hypothetical protein
MQRKFGRKTLKSGGYKMKVNRVYERTSRMKVGDISTHLTRDRVLDVVSYEPVSGKFYWKIPPRPGIPISTEAGSLTWGYVEIVLYGVRVRAHQLVWFLETGEWTDRVIDHKNRVRDDNRFENLRLATPSENTANRALKKTPVSGLRGVSIHKSTGLWRARVAGKCWYFKTPEAAHQKYLEEAKAKWGEFFHAG